MIVLYNTTSGFKLALQDRATGNRPAAPKSDEINGMEAPENGRFVVSLPGWSGKPGKGKWQR